MISGIAVTEQTITFPNGFVGIPDWREFVLSRVEERPRLWTLQHMENPEVCFVLMEPFAEGLDYAPALTDGDLAALGAPSVRDVNVYCTVRLDEASGGLTANLLGPLFINRSTGLGVQVVLYDSGYETAHPVQLAEPSSAPVAAGRA